MSLGELTQVDGGDISRQIPNIDSIRIAQLSSRLQRPLEALALTHQVQQEGENHGEIIHEDDELEGIRCFN